MTAALISALEKASALGSKITCPLCGEADFDARGLAMHFKLGWCDVAEAAIEEERRADAAHIASLRARTKP